MLVDLETAISNVRSALESAQKDRSSSLLQLSEVEIELFGEFRQEEGSSGGLNFFAFVGKVADSATNSSGHRIRVKLTPRGANGVFFSSQ